MNIKSAEAFPRIVATRTQNKEHGLYLYEVTLFDDQGNYELIKMVAGRDFAQDSGNEHISNSDAPLPNGTYSVGALESAQGYNPELGGIWIGIQPHFQTNRTYLGMHFDPSFGLGKDSGTRGCLATISKQDKAKLVNFVQTYRPAILEVF